ncbi:hypothetical protein DFQ27_002017 [Actinomortierella ambigua]|uniref:BZIP domain-containing protein n=1 Tax=Actinomortierella ambigua TaxID=1343610 RepID=A0A9P6Q9J0_9FUNG|nr:hypothetical protein DFQ27_002017 [Actinomortierella ambigua]
MATAPATDFSMIDLINNNIKMSMSADSLESALTQFGKTATPGAHFASNTGNLVSSTLPSSTEGTGFDEWLAADLQFGSLSGDETSSLAGSSPFSSSIEDSPLLGFDSLTGGNSPSTLPVNLGPSLFEMPFATTVPTALTLNDLMPTPPASPLKLTAAAVRQAAAALNIPWSKDLEKALLSQATATTTSATESIDAVAKVATSPVILPLSSVPAMVIPKTEQDDIATTTTVTTPAPTPSLTPIAPAFTPIAPATTPSITSTMAAAVVSSLTMNTAASISAMTPATAATGTSTTVPVQPQRARKGSKRAMQMTPEDEANEIVLKRAKNTDAARRSRLKKLVRLETLECRVTDLESTNTQLTMQVAVLSSEKNGLMAKEAEQASRIAQLEAKLAEAHRALTSRA